MITVEYDVKNDEGSDGYCDGYSDEYIAFYLPEVFWIQGTVSVWDQPPTPLRHWSPDLVAQEMQTLQLALLQYLPPILIAQH